MLYTYPHYYRKFQCIASECEDTCCAGWEIMIDDKALEKYKKAKGPVGNRLKNSINWKEGSFLQYHHRCAFLMMKIYATCIQKWDRTAYAAPAACIPAM